MNAEGLGTEWAGRTIDGRYTLLEWLGGTEQSGVFLTEAPGSPARKAAIKLMPAEAGLAAWAETGSLAHPHLMQLIETGRCSMDGAPMVYAVSEYADEVLSEILPVRALTADEAGEMLGPVVETLAWLHGQGFVHGHVKPSNVLVVDDRLKLSSDRLCRMGEAGDLFAVEGIYRAPETVAGPMTAAADVWSLGALLVEALTQRLPVWDGSGEPAAPMMLPQPYAGIARRCLQADPAERCTLKEIEGWLRPAGIGTTAQEKPARGRFPVWALVAAVVLVIAAVGWMAMRPHGSEAQLVSGTPAAQASGEEKPAAGKRAAGRAPAPAAVEDSAQTPEPAAAEAGARTAVDAGPKGPVAAGAVSKRVMPEILPAAQESIQGKVNVRLRLTVDAAGNVSETAFESEGPSRYFAKAAEDAARQWKFKPAVADGRAAGSAWIVEFEFTRAGTEVVQSAAR